MAPTIFFVIRPKNGIKYLYTWVILSWYNLKCLNFALFLHNSNATSNITLHCGWHGMALEISIIILHSDVMIQKYTNKTGNNLIVWSITMIKRMRADRVLLKTLSFTAKSSHKNISSCMTLYFVKLTIAVMGKRRWRTSNYLSAFTIIIFDPVLLN